MDTPSNIDTVQIGYEETAYNSRQAPAQHTPAHTEVQDALTLASMLQQLRSQKLNGDTAGELQPYA